MMNIGKDLRRRWVDYTFMAVFVILIVIVITSSASNVFFTQRNFTNVSSQIVANGLISLGQLIVILTGGIDLSVGPVVALTGIMAAGFQQYLYLPLVVLAVLVVGVLGGVLNGFLVARLKLQPFIATLATMSVYRGAVYVYSEIPITPSNPAFRTSLGGAFVGPIPVLVIIMLVCYPLVWVFLNRTTFGRATVAIGGNEKAVRLAGINVAGHITLAYMLCSFFASIAGILVASRLGYAQPSVGLGYELDAIAAVVIGGGILGGGGGSVLGTFGGVIILGLINNLLNLFNVQSYYQQISKGIIIVIAVLARRKE
jgi:ribose transport system permease protein